MNKRTTSRKTVNEKRVPNREPRNGKRETSDEHYMSHALALALKAHPTPNPKVGAVLVKNNKIIGEGFHAHAGSDHAEIKALKGIGSLDSARDRLRAKGATLYVTLEPCAHYGKTPPCIDAVLKSGVKRVVIAMKDPNPQVSGRSIRALKKAGIKTTIGILEDEAKHINEAFIHFMKTGTSFITIKTAMSLDGKIATTTGDSRGLSGSTEQRWVQGLRADAHAILVGISTVLKDNPLLTARLPNARDPLRIILDSTLRIPLRANVLKDPNVLIVTTHAASPRKEAELGKRGIAVVRCGIARVDIKKLIRLLGAQGITSVLVEGGGEINAAFLQAGVVQKLMISIAPKILGGRDAKTLVEGDGVRFVKDALKLKKVTISSVSEDIVVTGYVSPWGSRPPPLIRVTEGPPKLY